jgi:hypothetical protein
VFRTQVRPEHVCERSGQHGVQQLRAEQRLGRGIDLLIGLPLRTTLVSVPFAWPRSKFRSFRDAVCALLISLFLPLVIGSLACFCAQNLGFTGPNGSWMEFWELVLQLLRCRSA